MNYLPYSSIIFTVDRWTSVKIPFYYTFFGMQAGSLSEKQAAQAATVGFLSSDCNETVY